VHFINWFRLNSKTSALVDTAFLLCMLTWSSRRSFGTGCEQPQGRLVAPDTAGVPRPGPALLPDQQTLVGFVLRRLRRRCPTLDRASVHRATEPPGLKHYSGLGGPPARAFTPGLQAEALARIPVASAFTVGDAAEAGELQVPISSSPARAALPRIAQPQRATSMTGRRPGHALCPQAGDVRCRISASAGPVPLWRPSIDDDGQPPRDRRRGCAPARGARGAAVLSAEVGDCDDERRVACRPGSTQGGQLGSASARRARRRARSSSMAIGTTETRTMPIRMNSMLFLTKAISPRK
jgi:hypothetical protein